MMLRHSLRYTLTTWHGEGNTLWYIQRVDASGEPWETVLTFQSAEGETRQDAERFLSALEGGE